MRSTKSKIIGALLSLVMLTTAAFTQNPARPSPVSNLPGLYFASQYNGYSTETSVGISPSGAGSITVKASQFVAPGSFAYQPFAANVRVKVDVGSSAETVTLTSAAGCNGGVSLTSCVLSGTFSNAHAGQGVRVASGSFGLDEAYADAAAQGGGLVMVDSFWAGTQAILQAVPSGLLANNVVIADVRAGAPVFYYPRPSVLTVIPTAVAAVPVAAAPAGIPAGTMHVRQTYTDLLGGESLVSADATVTTTAPLGTITVPPPPATAGAVGWRLYVGAAAGSAGAEILYVPASAGCTQSTLTPLPSCAMSSSAVFSALVTGTGADPIQSTAHTTFTVAPFQNSPLPFQNVYGPFTALATISTIQQAAEVQLPAGFFNQLGKRYQICGDVISLPLATAVPTYTLTLSPNFTVSPVTIVSFVYSGTATTNVAQNARFCVETTTAATGSSGTLEVHGNFAQAIASTGVPGQSLIDGNQAASSAIDLTKQLTLAVTYTSGTANTTSAQVRDLSIFPIN